MCLAIPMVLVEKDEFEGVAEVDGVRKKISLMFVPEAEKGEYVLVHAGFAIGQVDAEGAAETLELLSRPYSGEGDGKGGTYFGATGCGKSFTMLFLSRLLMKSIELASPTIVLMPNVECPYFNTASAASYANPLFQNSGRRANPTSVKSRDSRNSSPHMPIGISLSFNSTNN